jgi:hypothetical protein
VRHRQGVASARTGGVNSSTGREAAEEHRREQHEQRQAGQPGAPIRTVAITGQARRREHGKAIAATIVASSPSINAEPRHQGAIVRRRSPHRVKAGLAAEDLGWTDRSVRKADDPTRAFTTAQPGDGHVLEDQRLHRAEERDHAGCDGASLTTSARVGAATTWDRGDVGLARCASPVPRTRHAR